ncbi:MULTISPECIES: DUF2061 domain-containing protein [unclassified Saccharicrinis]|uniref:DUF2061 domain-containing protein n=1 Tax=unclassified Saccharicrinis TaxID=2646859 RepID=UPI0035D8A45D
MPKKLESARIVEKRSRSIVKTISWRTLGTIDTIIISYFIIGDVHFAMAIGGVEVFTKMALYFFHERAWSRINFGRAKETPIDYEI